MASGDARCLTDWCRPRFVDLVELPGAVSHVKWIIRPCGRIRDFG
jgi:hypothetical protein